MNIVCLDLEGVLIPEIWQAVADTTGIDALLRTTRDEPDYDVLMKYRLKILDEHNIRIDRIHEIIAQLSPLEGAASFVQWLKSQTRLIILSDTFEAFATPLMKQLDWPTLFCHNLQIDTEGRIVDYKLRQADQKRKAVEAFRSLHFKIIAAGDSYNDLSMLQSADHGIFFRPPTSITEAYPKFPVVHTHAELKAEIEKHLNA